MSKKERSNHKGLKHIITNLGCNVVKWQGIGVELNDDNDGITNEI
jgi:hypothetical protein